MQVLTVLVYTVSALTALLGLYYTVKEYSADLVLLGAALLTALVWGGECIGLIVRSLGGPGPSDPITLWGYALTGLLLPVGGAWLGLFERSKWGSLAVCITAATLIVLQMRLAQIWPGGFCA